MTIKQFIQKGIEGDWKPKEFPLTEEPKENIGVRVLTEKQIEDLGEIFDIQFYSIEYPEEGYMYSTKIEDIILDPSAWEAVGKVEGWEAPDNVVAHDLVCPIHGNEDIQVAESEEGYGGGLFCEVCPALNWADENPELILLWQYNMHKMIDALCEGKSVEENIKTL